MPENIPAPESQNPDSANASDRVARTRAALTRLFGRDISQDQSTDPEFKAIL